MKKKMMCVLLAAGMAASVLVGCGLDNKTAGKDKMVDANAELALVIGEAAMEEHSLNESVWEGVKKYGDEKDISYQYYTSEEATTEAYEDAIEAAVEGGAKVIVCSGSSFETPVYHMQKEYSDVKFILMDGQPKDSETYETAENTMTILYQEEQAGFLAGYAAVKDGGISLGFIGADKQPSVVRYGYGYLAGAEYAAQEMDVDVMVTYAYTGTSEAAEAMAVGWFNAGINVIFTFGGEIGDSVITAAEANDGKVIAADMDLSSESETIICSAVKMLSNTSYAAVSSAYDGTFAGGGTMTFNVTNDGVGLAMDSAKWNQFTKEDYDAVCAKLDAGEITINNDIEKDVADFVFSRVMVNYVQQ